MFSLHLFRSYWNNKKDLEIDLYVCGWAEYDKIIYKSDNLIDLVSEKLKSLSIDLLNNFLLDLNGNFSFLIVSKDSIKVCADKMRCYPVIYFKYNDTTYITDDIDAFLQKYPSIRLIVNENNIEQYLCTDFIFGPNTLFKNVFSLQAGEIVEITSNKYNRHQYFQWSPIMKVANHRDIYKESSLLDTIFISVIHRMINSAPKVHNWIIPLSGGHDSRMIVNYLYKLGVKNVICYSFGVKNNWQSIISERVAKALGYEWFFIEHSQEILSEIQKSQVIDNYRKYAFNGTSVPHLQDFIAIYMLKKKEIIKSGDIIVPGHTLNFIAGDQLKMGMEVCDSINSTIPYIKIHFSQFGYAPKSVNVLNLVLSIIKNYNVDVNQIPEYFNWQEVHTKYIANWVKCYEYFGFEWRMPLWDNELINYWSKIGFNFRFDRKLFFLMERNYLLLDVLKDIPFANDILIKEKSLKDRIIESIPLFLKKIIRYLGYSKSTYFVPDGLHLLYSGKHETITEYQNKNSIPDVVLIYLSNYPGNMKLSSFSVNSVSTLMIINDYYNKVVD